MRKRKKPAHTDLKRASKAVILARVSSKEQEEEGHSIEAQKHRLETYCQRNGLQILKVFELVESSTVGDRTQFMEMIRFVKRSRETIAVVADKIDRVQRSFKEHPMLDALIQSGKIELHFNSENYVIHKNSVSQERLMWSMGVIMAQSYVDSLRDNVKRSIEQKIRQGEWISFAPFGYQNIKNNKKGDVIINPERAAIVKKMFKTYATGCHTLEEIRLKTIEWGARNRGQSKSNLSKSQIHQILTNPFYYGQMMVKGQLYDHRYEPIIEKNLFDQCQGILKGWNKKRFEWAGKEFIFRGILTCATTGRMVTADTKKRTYVSGKTAEWTYLRCFNPEQPNKVMWVREELVLKQIKNLLNDIHIPSPMLERLKLYIRQTHKNEQEFLARQLFELQNEYQLFQSRLDKLMDLLLDGTIDKSDFDIKKTTLRAKQIEIENQIAVQRHGDDGFKDSLISILAILSNSHELFKSSQIAIKRQILNLVFANLNLKGTTLCYSLRKPFELFINVQGIEEWLPLIDTLRTDLALRSLIVNICETFSIDEVTKNCH